MPYDKINVIVSSGSLYLNDESQTPNYIYCGKEMTYSENQIVLWSPDKGEYANWSVMIKDIDMFPWTGHVEYAVLMSRVES
jgi:hypothetical protein